MEGFELLRLADEDATAEDVDLEASAAVDDDVVPANLCPLIDHLK